VCVLFSEHNHIQNVPFTVERTKAPASSRTSRDSNGAKLVRLSRRWEDITKMDRKSKRMGRSVQDRNKWRSVVCAVNKRRAPRNAENFLTS
jgi:hypothetical protein